MAWVNGQQVVAVLGSVIWPDGWRFAEKLIPETCRAMSER